MRKRIILFVLFVIAALAIYLLFAPVSITPAAWTPPVAPTLTGQYAQNTRLFAIQRISLGDGHKPEDVAVDAERRIYAGFEDGRIIQLQSDGTQPRVFAKTDGRPLGLAFDRDGNLIVTDAIRGLLSIDKNGNTKVLVTEADGTRMGPVFCPRCQRANPPDNCRGWRGRRIRAWRQRPG